MTSPYGAPWVHWDRIISSAWVQHGCAKAESNQGEKVTVSLGLEGPQEANLAEDIAQALSTNPKAKTFFDGLPTHYRKNYIRWMESAKREETRARRIDEMIRLLEEGKRQK